MKKYSRSLILLLALDAFLLALGTLGNCRRGEMISSAAYTLRRDGRWWGWTADFIDWLFSSMQEDHCHKSYLWQREIYKDDAPPPVWPDIAVK